MIYFNNDYSEGAHPLILEKLAQTNFQQTYGYGVDEYSVRTERHIRQMCNRDDLDVYLLTGGTQANLTIISSILRPYQGVLAADTGHIAVHEAGAIEATGHKVLTLPSTDGKITALQIYEACQEHYSSPNAHHCVQPALVYISLPTEMGTLYSKSELEELYYYCQKCRIPLFIDGARLGYGLSSPANDLTLADIANLCDVFYIGGTKCGALFGEAVVISSFNLKKDFSYCVKQRGGLLAKGRILGIQFDTLFTDDLYFNICRDAVTYALAIKAAFLDAGVEMYIDSPTNQQFPLLSVPQMQKLSEKYVFEVWGEFDETRKITRFCTSWATNAANVDSLIKDIKHLTLD